MKNNDGMVLIGIAFLGAAAFAAGYQLGMKVREEQLQEDEAYIEMLEEEIVNLKDNSLRNRIRKYRASRPVKF